MRRKMGEVVMRGLKVQMPSRHGTARGGLPWDGHARGVDVSSVDTSGVGRRWADASVRRCVRLRWIEWPHAGVQTSIGMMADLARHLSRAISFPKPHVYRQYRLLPLRRTGRPPPPARTHPCPGP